jgi:fumarylacetoacetase
MTLDATHDPARQSWVSSANVEGTDFPVQNLPFGRFVAGGVDPSKVQASSRLGVAIGDQVLDLSQAVHAVRWKPDVATAMAPLAQGDLNAFMALGGLAWRLVRTALCDALTQGSALQAVLQPCLVAQTSVRMLLPCRIGDYTDFYAGIHHATAVGRLFRPDNPLLANYKWVPIGYHGRSSSIVPSGTPIKRPQGQIKGVDDEAPRYALVQRLDYELELAFFVGPANAQGEAVPIDRAGEHVFGVALLNDWSARDVQAWEYQPLGPFLSKNFGSTLSPWIVTMEALAPFRAPLVRPAGDPAPLAYLHAEADQRHGNLDIHVQALLQTATMRRAGRAPHRLSQSSVREALYWTPAQLLAHHTSGGCNLQPGDVLGSGTLSGPQPSQAGSLLELSQGGKVAVEVGEGESRRFLQDGDSLTLRAWCERAGARRLGFGPCEGTVAAG